MATIGGAPPVPTDRISPGYVKFISVASVFSAISTVCVVLRFASRRLTRSIGWDDWTSLGALIFLYGFLTTTVLVTKLAYAGYHIAGYNVEQFETYLKIVLANNVIYNCSISLSKISVLLFYRRIFSVKSFRPWFYSFLFVVCGYWIAAVFGLIFAYHPTDAQWKFLEPHTTINNKAFWLAAGIINVFVDFGILCLPQPYVWRLQLVPRRKVLLSLLFLVGFFTCIASIVRIVTLSQINLSDPTYSLVDAGIWTFIETSLSIVCGCGPTFPHLFRHLYDKTPSSFMQFSFRSSTSSRRRFLGLREKSGSSMSDTSNSSQSASHQDSVQANIEKGALQPVHVRTDIDIVQVERSEDEPRTSRHEW